MLYIFAFCNGAIKSLSKKKMMTPSEIIDQLRQLQAAQGDRARVYNDFKTAFKQFLNDPSSIQSYTQSCQVITQEMQEISSNVRNIENKFGQNENTRQYASLIRKLQNQEKQKLETTIAMQKVQQQILLEKQRIQKEEMHESETGHLCAVHDCQLHSHEQVRGEKLAYLEMDLRKYQSHMNTIINEINDLLEEIKYEIEDLTENL